MRTPDSRERLDKAIPRIARAHGFIESRVRTWVAFLAISGALENAVKCGLIVSYQLKGGAALELRFPNTARATQDLDIGIPGSRTQRLSALSAALSAGYDDFSFRLKPRAHHMDVVDTLRVEVAVMHRSRPLVSVVVDLGPVEAASQAVVPHMPLMSELGLAVPSVIACTSLADQIAQKLHASTHPRIVADIKQNRAKDVIDILMLRSLGQLDPGEVRVAAESIFRARSAHEWPPAIPNYPAGWRATMEQLAEENGYPIRDSNGLIAEYSAVVAEILGVEVQANYRYHFIVLTPQQGVPNVTQDVFVTDEGFTTFMRMTQQEGYRLSQLVQYPGAQRAMIAVLERPLTSGE